MTTTAHTHTRMNINLFSKVPRENAILIILLFKIRRLAHLNESR